jgi:hypothetical protein
MTENCLNRFVVVALRVPAVISEQDSSSPITQSSLLSELLWFDEPLCDVGWDLG